MLNDIDDIQEVSFVNFHYSRELLIFTFKKPFRPNLSKRLYIIKLKSMIDEIVYLYIYKIDTAFNKRDTGNLLQYN